MTYRTAIESLDLVVVQEAEIGTHRGDWVAVVIDSALNPNGGGLVTQPYGCCPSCDEWEATTTVLQRVEILHRVVRNARWFETPRTMRTWIIDSMAADDWPFVLSPEWNPFVEATLNALNADSWADVYDEVMRSSCPTSIEICREPVVSEQMMVDLEAAVMDG